MSLTIYGFPQSRALRALWMAHELGLDFKHEMGMGPDGAGDALLAANPMGQVPTIVDDDFALCESMAINIYLAKKHGKLAPATLECTPHAAALKRGEPRRVVANATG